jgi:hypothetical protein
MIMKKRLLSGISTLMLLSSLSAHTVHAQTVPPSAKLSPFAYDASQEVEIQGNVATILLLPAHGMIPGSHLILTSPSGQVDVSLGVFGLRGPSSLSVNPGQQVLVTGVLKTIRGKQVFLARTVRVGENVFAIRNEHGIPVPPQARNRTSQENVNQGATR